MTYPTAVVVDTIDGYVFRAGVDGVLFTVATATQFARESNAARKPGHQTYAVFGLLHRVVTHLAVVGSFR
jgi:hypothetical protein